MKSIEDTLETIRAIMSAVAGEVEIALAGGMAVIIHGVERTTRDVDVCLYSKTIDQEGSSAFLSELRRVLPANFSATLATGGKFPDDPFKNDVIFIEDRQGEHLNIDLLVARYKWELEGIRRAETMLGIPVPVLPKPYLAAMKLRAAGYKDASDVVDLMRLMSEQEKTETTELARRVGREKKLARLLAGPEPDDEVHESPDEYIH
ncbi:MAG TPA: nucleotidyl transferase AbiEii/AbiGii toxin family protein [Myxococcota bacterium]|nr:nucleotidyl transferase AbiEii/AbiGii toxin family protein [Myxococcota bacterium]